VRAVADFLGLKTVGVALDGEGIVPEALDRACRARHPKALYCVPSLQNPTAGIQSAERRAAIAEVARAHGLPIVDDAIHHALLDPQAPGGRPPLVASLAPELTYLIASPSKVVAGGLRVAFLATPPAAARSVLSHRLWATTWMVAPLAAEIMAGWIEDGTALATVERKREESRARLALAHRVLDDRCRVRSASVGYHAWIELPEGQDDVGALVAAAARRAGVVTGMSAFRVSAAAASDTTDGPLPGVRVSVSGPRNRDTLERGLRLLGDVLTQEAAIGPPVV